MSRTIGLILAAAAVGAFSVRHAEGRDMRAEGHGERPKRGDIVFETHFDTASGRDAWPQTPWAQWVELAERGTCLKASVPEADASETHMIRLPLTVDRLSDCKLHFECLAKAEGVSENQTRDEMVSITSLRSFVPPSHISGMILYLCSDMGATITGQAISVDSGLEGMGG